MCCSDVLGAMHACSYTGVCVYGKKVRLPGSLLQNFKVMKQHLMNEQICCSIMLIALPSQVCACMQRSKGQPFCVTCVRKRVMTHSVFMQAPLPGPEAQGSLPD